jgi:TldD protein
MAHEVDGSFFALPFLELADAGLDRAGALGARVASVRVARVRTSSLVLRDGLVSNRDDSTDTGVAVRLVHGGARGFAAASALTPEATASCAERAVRMARQRAGFGTPAEMAPEPVHPGEIWVGGYETNPFEVSQVEQIALLEQWSKRLLSAARVDHVQIMLNVVQENTFYADQAGTVTIQQRLRTHPMVVCAGTHPRTGATAMLRTLGPPTGRGWEYLLGEGWDWEAELAGLPDLLGEKLLAPAVEPGIGDLVIDPSNLWLTLHETVGHATEFDRMLGHAGTSFVTPEGIGSLRFGSPLMNVTADRTTEHGLATVGFDDEGVAAQAWNLITDGILTGVQLDRGTARQAGAGRSNGCAFAESAMHAPMQRMPNVSLSPAPSGPGVAELVSEVTDGVYVVGSGSWSIDARRRNFQFTAQRCYRISDGRLAGQVRGVAYTGTTPEFWGSLAGLGGPQTYHTFGADLCGKGQPVQIAAASHGCPAALFRQIEVLNLGSAA